MEAQGKKVQAPNWDEKEILVCKKAAYEVSTSNGIVKKGSLAQQTADCYRRHARLLCHEEGLHPWVDRPWPAKGKKCLYTLEDSITKRTESDLWKQAGKIDTEIRKTHMVAWNNFTLDDGSIPSGKTIEDGLEFVKQAHWQAQEEKRLATKQKKQAKEAAPAAAPPPEGAAPPPAAAPPTETLSPMPVTGPDGIVFVQGQPVSEAELAVLPVAPLADVQPTCQPIGRLGMLAQYASSAMSWVTGLAEEEDDNEDNGEEEVGDSVRPMPASHNGGIYYLTWLTLGPVGEKLACYMDAGEYNTKAVPSRVEQREMAKGKKRAHAETNQENQGNAESSTHTAQLSLQGAPQGSQQNVIKESVAHNNYAFACEVERLKLLVQYAESEEELTKAKKSLCDYLKSSQVKRPDV